MRQHLLAAAAAFSLCSIAPVSAQVADPVDAGDTETVPAQQSDLAYVRALLLPEQAIIEALAPFALTPIIDATLVYPELDPLFESDEAFDAMYSASGNTMVEGLEAAFPEFRERMESYIGEQVSAEELGEIARLAREREASLKPAMESITQSAITYTNVTSIRDDAELANQFSELRSAGGGELLRLQATANRALLGWLENRKDEVYGRMLGSVLVIAVEEDITLPSFEKMETEAAERPALAAVFGQLSGDASEIREFSSTATDASLDFIVQTSPEFAASFAKYQGLRPFLKEKATQRAMKIVADEQGKIRLGFIRRLGAVLDEERAERVLSFLYSPLGKKFVGTVDAEETRQVVTSILEAQAGASDLEEASEEGGEAFASWVSAVTETLDLSEEEATRLDGVLASQVGEDLYEMTLVLQDYGALQNTYSMLRYLPRNSLLLRQDLEAYIQEQSSQE